MKSSKGAAGATVTRSEFAAMKGWRPSYITKLIAQRRLVLTADGKKVDVEASNRLLEETKRIDRQGVREHHARRRGGNGVEPSIASGGPASDHPLPEAGPAGLSATPPAPPAGNTDQDDYNQARAKKEAAAAEMAEIELAKRKAEVVSIGQVRDMAERIAGVISRGFERIVPRIGPVWSVEQDPLKREQLLEDELRKVQHEWADEVEKLIGAGGA